MRVSSPGSVPLPLPLLLPLCHPPNSFFFFFRSNERNLKGGLCHVPFSNPGLYMEIWDSLNPRYLDFIKKRGARREEEEEESWLFRGLLPLPLLLPLLLLLREPGRGRAEELVARRALVPGSGFLPKKGKAGKKCKAAAGGAGEPRPRDGELDDRRALAAAPGAAGPPPESQSPEPRAAGPGTRPSRCPPVRASPLAGALASKLLQPASPLGCRRRSSPRRSPGPEKWESPWGGL